MNKKTNKKLKAYQNGNLHNDGFKFFNLCDETIQKLKQYAKENYDCDNFRENYYRSMRIANISSEIATKEKADKFLVTSAAWLLPEITKDLNSCKPFEYANIPFEFKNQIIDLCCNIISKTKPKTNEEKCLNDGILLDKIGATGLANTFCLDARRDIATYNAETTACNISCIADFENFNNNSIRNIQSTITYVQENLATPYAKKLAQERIDFMNLFLLRFYDEWYGLL